MKKGADFSKCGKYRYALWRIWDESKPNVMFVGLNPSTANTETDDPTIRRVIQIAKGWGFGGVFMVNCFPYVSTDPTQLVLEEGVHGDLNRHIIMLVAQRCERIVFAWGAFKVAQERGKILAERFPHAVALKINADGSPKHPLYCRADTVPVLYNQSEPAEAQTSLPL